MEKTPDLHFFSFYVQFDESHHERIFFTIGTPIKQLEEIRKEAEDEFYFAVSEGKDCSFNEFLLQKLKENEYQEVNVKERISYPDPYYMSSEYVEEMIYAREGETYYDEEFKERLNEVRIKNGKEPFPIIKKIKKENVQTVSLERIASTDDDILAAFDQFIKDTQS